MSISGIYIHLIVGVLALYIGAEVLVFFASRLALSLGMSSLMTGLTVVAASTSMPELASSLMAQFQGQGASMALGNIIGSNIANIALILGALALFYPIKLHRNVRMFELPLGIILTALLWLLMLKGQISRFYGFLLLLGFIAYLFWHIYQAKAAPQEKKDPLQKKNMWTKLFFLFLVFIGAMITVYGAYLFIEGAIALSYHYQISPRIVGLTLVAVGSSLPEFAASFIAMIRKNPALAIGNILGSNLLNILMVLGVVATVKPLTFPNVFTTQDMPILLFFSVFITALGLWKKKITRLPGALLLIGYIGYLYILF